MIDRKTAAENRRVDTIDMLEQALKSARRGYWGQCAERAAAASKSADAWNNAADVWQRFESSQSEAQPKDSQPTRDDVRNQALEEAAKITEQFCACDNGQDGINLMLRQRAQRIRSLKGAPSEQKGSEQ